MANMGIIKATGKKSYMELRYINGVEYWKICGTNKMLPREDVEGLPDIPRKEFIEELKSLFTKYNASIDVDYSETCVLGEPTTINIYLGDFKILEVNRAWIDKDDFQI